MKKQLFFTTILSIALLPALSHAESNPCPNTVGKPKYSSISLKVKPWTVVYAEVRAKCVDGQTTTVFSRLKPNDYEQGIINAQNIKELIITPRKGRDKRTYTINQDALIKNNGKTCTLEHRSKIVPVHKKAIFSKKKRISYYRCLESIWPNPTPKW